MDNFAKNYKDPSILLSFCKLFFYGQGGHRLITIIIAILIFFIVPDF